LNSFEFNINLRTNTNFENIRSILSPNSSFILFKVGVLKVHSSGVVTSASSSSNKMQIHSPTQTISNAQVCLDPMALNDVDYTQVLSTITNADGTVSILQVDPNNPIITLPDGTTAQVQGVATLHTTQGEGGTTVHSVQGIDANGHPENMTVDLTDATLGQDGQIIITGEDGHSYPISVNGMITLPVSASMYQTMVANIQHLHPNGDGTVCITPMQVHPVQNFQSTFSNNGKLVRAIISGSKISSNTISYPSNIKSITEINNNSNGLTGKSSQKISHTNNSSDNNSSNVIIQLSPTCRSPTILNFKKDTEIKTEFETELTATESN
jgi:hypothetical protein